MGNFQISFHPNEAAISFSNLLYLRGPLMQLPQEWANTKQKEKVQNGAGLSQNTCRQAHTCSALLPSWKNYPVFLVLQTHSAQPCCRAELTRSRVPIWSQTRYVINWWVMCCLMSALLAAWWVQLAGSWKNSLTSNLNAKKEKKNTYFDWFLVPSVLPAKFFTVSQHTLDTCIQCSKVR